MMSLIEINLYPYKKGKQNKIFTFIDKYFFYVYLAAIGGIALNVIFLLIYLFLNIPYSGLEKKWQEIKPEAKKIDALKTEITQLQQQKNKYSNLLAPEINISQAMAAVFESAPKNIWLENLSYNKNNINIKGYAVYWEGAPLIAVDKLIENLKENQYLSERFQSIKLVSSRKVYVNNQQVVEFKVECSKE